MKEQTIRRKVLILPPAGRSCLYDFGGSHGSHRHRHQSHGHCYLGGWQRGEDIIIIVSLMMTKMTMTVVMTMISHDPNILGWVSSFWAAEQHFWDEADVPHGILLISNFLML